MNSEHSTPAERHELGRSKRSSIPLDAHAEFTTGAGRPDPVKLVEEQNEDRIPWLVPVRRARMSASAFTFYRGSARIMAADLANTPVSGLTTQICGDAHLSNFGLYASPERRLVFDLNDFDETLPGPWEWDVKRLAASLVLAGRDNGLGRKESGKLVRRAVSTYRKGMAQLAEMGVCDVWYSMVEVEKLGKTLKKGRHRRIVVESSKRARRKDSRHALEKLAEDVGESYRIRSNPPFLIPFRELRSIEDRSAAEKSLSESYKQYKANVPDHLEQLLNRYSPIDFAVKVVGVGSVGTRCFILLLEGRDRHDPLFLQVKEANKSVLEEYLPPSKYHSPGRRVVEGQRLMQTVSDIFLGHIRSKHSGHHYYVRQLKDWKASVDTGDTDEESLLVLAQNRGWTLARSHARAGDPIAISGYLGHTKAFDKAIAEFAERYAEQAEQDYLAFGAEIKSGRLEAAEYE